MCGWNPYEIERRKRKIRTSGLLKGPDGLKKLHIKTSLRYIGYMRKKVDKNDAD